MLYLARGFFHLFTSSMKYLSQIKLTTSFPFKLTLEFRDVVAEYHKHLKTPKDNVAAIIIRILDLISDQLLDKTAKFKGADKPMTFIRNIPSSDPGKS